MQRHVQSLIKSSHFSIFKKGCVDISVFCLKVIALSRILMIFFQINLISGIAGYACYIEGENV